MTKEEYDKKVEDSQLVTIDGKTWRLTLGGGGVTWENADDDAAGEQTKQGQVDGCALAEAPPCPTLEVEEDMSELTMADQVSMAQRVHIRQKILENRPDGRSTLP